MIDSEKSSSKDKRERRRSASPNHETSRPAEKRQDWRPQDKPIRRRDEVGFPKQLAAEKNDEELPEKEKINLKQSGLLAAEQNTYKGVVVKYSEPPEARIPDVKWRLHVFKGDEQLDVIKLSASAFLIGKDRVVVDIAVDHPSCSKQHAAIQFRQVSKRDEYGESRRVIK
jgi:smad nuclear-interacting protein 1